jgi:hypothetical protein
MRIDVLFPTEQGKGNTEEMIGNAQASMPPVSHPDVPQHRKYGALPSHQKYQRLNSDAQFLQLAQI